MSSKRKFNFFEELIPEDDKKQRLTNILPFGTHRFPVVYPEIAKFRLLPLLV